MTVSDAEAPAVGLAELVHVDRSTAGVGLRALRGGKPRRRRRSGSALPQIRGTLLAALAGVIVAAAGAGGPSRISRRVAVITAGVGLVLTVVAFATGNRPILAGLAMAAVALVATYLLWPRDDESDEPVPVTT